jgi:hypothetical protein
MIHMRNSRQIIVSVVFGAVLLLLLLWHTQTERTYRKLLSERDREIVRLTSENSRLSGQLWAKKDTAGFARERTAEVLRLRAQLSDLRARQRAAAALQQKSPPASAPAGEEEGPTEPASLEPVIVLRDDWAFRGFATPEAAIESVVWAMSQGNLEALLGSVSDEHRAALAQSFQGKSDAEIANELQTEMAGLEGLRIDRQRVEPDGQVTFILNSLEEDNGVTRTRDEAVMRFKNVDGQWKYNQ